ncbi:hypothetical protein [Heyndrickxia faecalis]|uniref:hypothetical protein n=1 Tax=Heyndrickxia faecalis TaxID=2824910 RepID=UPI0032B1C2D7
MAWHEGVYACGHPGRVQIYGPVKDRDWKAKREFAKLCPECWKKKADEENKKAVEAAKELGLPELKGTEKQVAWANSIRLEVINDKYNEWLEYLLESRKPELHDQIKTGMEQVRDYLIKNKTDASYYIDRRGYGFSVFVEDIGRELGWK